MTCIYCHAENEQGEQLCRACFRKLPPELPVPPPADPQDFSPATDERRPPDPPAENLPVEASATCPHCGEEVPDPRNRVCVECHRSLERPQPLRLSFPGGEVTVHAAGPVGLGRDPARSPVAAVFAAHDNVSRLHATVGIDDQGAWVRDERSLNGTYVNDVPVPPGIRITLAAGDTLRLAADITATVRFARNESS
ncbi:MAG: FHA domain-containing protein [Pseudonocardiaceae bacterium]